VRAIKVNRILVNPEIEGLKPYYVVDLLVGGETIRLKESEADAFLTAFQIFNRSLNEKRLRLTIKSLDEEIFDQSSRTDWRLLS